MTEPKNPAAENRRRQLRQWIADRFAGRQAEFIKSTHDGDQQINQGELSGLLKDKSFGEKRARKLEKQAGMPSGYLELPAPLPSEAKIAATPDDVVRTTPAPGVTEWPHRAAEPLPEWPRPAAPWPFKTISPAEYFALDDHQRGRVEGFIQAMYSEPRSDKSHLVTKTA